MKYVADYIHRKGLRAGIYLPVGLEKEAYDKGGDFTVADAPECHAHDLIYPDRRTTNGWDSAYKMDFSKPCAQKYIDSVAKQLADWGYDFFKLDGIGPGSNKSGPNYDNRPVSLVGLHLLHRIYGTMIDAAPDIDAARAVVDRAESTLGNEDRCSFCSIMLAVPAARACAHAGDLDDARRHLKIAERHESLWEGTSWQASLAETRAHIARAEHRDAEARRQFADAAALFDAAGQPLDARRRRS